MVIWLYECCVWSCVVWLWWVQVTTSCISQRREKVGPGRSSGAAWTSALKSLPDSALHQSFSSLFSHQSNIHSFKPWLFITDLTQKVIFWNKNDENDSVSNKNMAKIMYCYYISEHHDEECVVSMEDFFKQPDEYLLRWGEHNPQLINQVWNIFDWNNFWCCWIVQCNVERESLHRCNNCHREKIFPGRFVRIIFCLLWDVIVRLTSWFSPPAVLTSENFWSTCHRALIQSSISRWYLLTYLQWRVYLVSPSL